jgi:hypothetical protein
MGNFIFNIAKGAFAEKFRDAAANGIVSLATVIEADAALADHDEFNALWGAAGNTEASDASYARKTGLTGTVTVDDSNDRVDVDIPDQTWTALAGAAIVALQVAYEESAAETGRIPLSNHVFAVTPDGSDVTVQFNAAGFGRAA